MKSDKEHLLGDICSHSESGQLMMSSATEQNFQKRQRYSFTFGLVSGLSVSLGVVIFLFFWSPNPIVRNNKPSPLPSQIFNTNIEQIEIGEWIKTLGIVQTENNPPVKSSEVAPVRASFCTINVSDRFDCWPATAAANQTDCESRGCCWEPSTVYGAPFCFYPSNYVSYAASTVVLSGAGLNATLARKTASPYPNDVVKVQVDVVYETATRLRIQIYDPNNPRFEVPMDLNKGPFQPVNPDYEVTVQDNPFGLLVSRKSTGAVLFDSRNMAPLVFADQFLQIGTSLSSPNIYGLGEHQSELRLNVNWRKLVIWTRDEGPDTFGNLYGAHPFYVNLESDGNAHGVFLFSSNAIEAALQPYAGGQGGLTLRSLGGILDFYVFSGPSPLQVVEQYVSLIGRPVMPPFWSLGFHLCKYGYGSTKNLSDVIERNRAIQIPYDVQWSDIDYMDAYKDWTYDSKGNYAGLDKLVEDLHSHNQRYVMIIDPGISSVQAPGSYPPFDEGVQMDIFIKNATGGILIGQVWPGQTAFPDFFHPKADEYWYNQMKNYHDQIDYDGIWLDMNEISNFIDGSTFGCTKGPLDIPPFTPEGIAGGSLMSKTVCPSAKQYLSTSYNLHNMYGWSEMRSTATNLRKLLGKRSFVLSRSTFVGSGYHGAHWTGDNVSEWPDLYYSIPSILNYNMYGVPLIGADVCGFMRNTTRELCIRWIQLGSFYPFMRNHADLPVRKPQDPASFDPEAIGYMRDVLETRYSLLPYMYTWFYLSHTTGTPVVRPLFTLFPNTETIDKQFMWGDGLLITPTLIQGATTVSAYIPRGLWYDLYNGTLLKTIGQEYLLLDSPLSRINVHVRGGTIIPRLPPAVTTDEMRTKPFFLQVVPDEKSFAQGLLYWDAGDSIDPVGQNQYTLLNFTLQGTTLVSEVQVGNYPGIKLDIVKVFGIHRQPKSVVLNGQTSVNFSFDAPSEVLTVINLNLDLLTAFTLSWSF